MPKGFRSAGVSCGLKRKGRLDLALVVADRAVPAAAVFTRNLVAAAPVHLSREHIADGRVRAVVINAGNANACTGVQGMADALATAEALAAQLGCATQDVIVCSTGVIGVPLPVDKVIAGCTDAVAALDTSGSEAVASAIMTTDTFPKRVVRTLDVAGRLITVEGIAKGSGMIRPDMATMLAVITTDAPLTSGACDTALRMACGRTFNRVTVDGDTSTNDAAVLLASGDAGGADIDEGHADYPAIASVIEQVTSELSRMIARDGEGATKLVVVTVTGAVDESDAEKAAFAVAESLLVKTALFGNDANWGRVAAAVGRSGARLAPESLAITFAGIEVCRFGGAVPFDEEEALLALKRDEVDVLIDLGVGAASATVLTCDLSYEYVRINGEYRS